MVDLAQRRSAASSWRFLLVLGCVLLLIVAGTVQVAHTHGGSGEIHADCPLCAAAHIAIQPATGPAPVPATAVTARLEVAAPSFVPPARSTFALFTRPPPAASAG
jgi:hypothetical protein